jgi:FRG domain
VRKKQPLELIFPEWCLLIRSYFLARSLLGIDRHRRGPGSAPFSKQVQADAQRLGGLDNHIFALSLAQHYGLPSMGLDLTDDLDVALFFALFHLERDKDRTFRVGANRSNEPSVLSIFGMPERFFAEHALARPRRFPRGRPDCQRAFFAPMGWGMRQNQCAGYLLRALYLDPQGDYGIMPSVNKLFPDQLEDDFGSLLETAIQENWGSVALQDFLKNLYWVAV